MSSLRLCIATQLVLGIFMGTVCTAAESQMATKLHTVLRSDTYRCTAGDLVQVRYRTRATSNGINTIQVQGGGNVLKQLAVVVSPIDPTDENIQPGSWYFVIVMFKVANAGEIKVNLTPVLNDGSAERPFSFAVKAQQ